MNYEKLEKIMIDAHRKDTRRQARDALDRLSPETRAKVLALVKARREDNRRTVRERAEAQDRLIAQGVIAPRDGGDE